MENALFKALSEPINPQLLSPQLEISDFLYQTPVTGEFCWLPLTASYGIIRPHHADALTSIFSEPLT